MPETCTAEQADFRSAWQQNGTAKMAAFLSPHELGELPTAVDASYELLRKHADDDPPTLTEFLADHYKRWDGIWVKELRGYLKQVKPDLLAQFDGAIAVAERRFRSLFDQNGGSSPISRSSAGTGRLGNTCPGISMPMPPASSMRPITPLIPGCRSIRSATSCPRSS
jgi:hypothetical protein